MDDVRQLTELAHDNGIATDYHICESPMTEQPHFKHLYTNPTFIREEDHPLVCELVDWLIEKQKSGYHMVNSVERLAQMKEFVQGELDDWNCRAGHNSLIVRVDGTLAPCFPMYSAGYDWGTIENHKFESEAVEGNEERVPEELLLYPEPHPGVLLQRSAGDYAGCSRRPSMGSRA